jgi:cytochrome P450 family 135
MGMAATSSTGSTGRTTAATARADVAPAAALPRGPRMPAIAQTLAWALAPTWLMDRCARKLGEAFTVTFAPSGLQLVLLSDPDAVKALFTAPPDVAPSATRDSPVAPIVGHSSVLVLTGPEHMRQRKLLLPPFHGERMREYEDVIVEATRRDMAGWPLGVPMQLHPHTRAITLEVILRAVFGVEDRLGELRHAIAGLLEPAQTLALVRFALRLGNQNGLPPGTIAKTLERVDELLYAEIARRREQSDLAERTDILSLLLQARDEDGQAMTDGELRDELVTLLLAGHETTATSVAWAIERLVRHPDKLARLIAEIDEGEREDYLMAVVNETLRVRPVVPIVVRLLQEDLQLGEHLLPAGTRAAASIYLTNRNPRVYDRPKEFRPERFLDSGGGGEINTFSWIPFGGGIRRCIGAAFAQLEMKLILRTVLAELEPALAPSRMWHTGEWNRRRAVTLVPAAGARVVWHRRSGE